MKAEIFPLEGIPEVEPGADLPGILRDALVRSGLQPRTGDVVAVTQKVVSKAEGRVVPESPAGKSGWVERETRRVVARREGLLIAETSHGFICANAGVDASNVAEGFLTLLPEDPDGSAGRIRAALSERAGGDVGVVVTDTFGRTSRTGVVDVAIGCAGIPPLLDLRGPKDAAGLVLQSTVIAVADQVAAAVGLVMGKADMIPAALVRGVTSEGAPGGASELVRGREHDLFFESPLQSIHGRRSVRVFGPGTVDRAVLLEAVEAACTAPAPHHTRPWLFAALDSGAARHRLLAAMATAWREDLERDGTPEEVIERRLRKSDALLGEAPVLVIPFVRLAGAHSYGDEERASAEREMFILSGGAAIQNLMLALHARGTGSCWVSSTLFCKEETRAALGLEDEWIPLGSVAVGPPPEGAPPPRPPVRPEDFLREVR